MPVAFIVDDHEDSLETLKILLSVEGFTAVAFKNFDEAFPAISRDHPCIALIDLHVSGNMKAAEFLQKTRALFPDLPVLIISGDARGHNTASTANAFFFLKPYSFDDVLQKVKESCPRTGSPS